MRHACTETLHFKLWRHFHWKQRPRWLRTAESLTRDSIHSGRDPFNQNFRKFRSKTQWIGSVQPEKFRKNGSTFWGGPLFPVGPVGILVEWIAPSIWETDAFRGSYKEWAGSVLELNLTIFRSHGHTKNPTKTSLPCSPAVDQSVGWV